MTDTLLQDALREKAFEDESAANLMRKAAREIDRLMRVYTAAADLADDPFGSLDQRKFYALRESFYPTRDE